MREETESRSELVAPITVLVAARDEATHASCVSALASDRQVRVVGHARTAFEVVTAARRLKPRVLVLGTSVGRRSLPLLFEILWEHRRRTRVLVVGARAVESRILDVLAHGARGHLELRRVPARLPKAVRVVDGGQAWLPRKLTPKLLTRLFDTRLAALPSRRTVRRSIAPPSNRQPSPPR